MIRLLVTAALLSVSADAFAQTALTGTKTVGTGGDYATIQAAVTALNANGAGTGGVVFAIQGGTYDLTTPIRFAVVGAADRPIEFRRAGAGDVIFTRQLAVADNAITAAAVGFTGATSYVTLRGLTIRTVNCRAIHLAATQNGPVTNFSIIGCRIEAEGSDAIILQNGIGSTSNATITDNAIQATGDKRWGIVNSGNGSLIARNLVRATNGINTHAVPGIVEDNQLFIRKEGIFVGMGGEIRRNRVQLVASTGGTGIWDFGNDTKIHHNTISFDPSAIEDTPDPVVGVSGGHSGIVLNNSKRPQVLFNSIYIRCVGHPGRNKASAGILILGWQLDHVWVQDVLFANNVIRGSASHDAGVDGSTVVYLYNWLAVSSVDMFGADNAGLRAALSMTGTTNDLSRHEQGTGSVITFAAQRRTAGSSTIVQQVDFRTLVEWQAFSGRDMTSVDLDPRFVSATNLHLQADSPVQGIGTTFPGYVRDIDGDRRKSPPDIGADEPRPGRLAGDASGDGSVDASDYLVWRKNLGRRWVGLGKLDGDFSADGVVDVGDYLFWRKMPVEWAGDVNGDGLVNLTDYNLLYDIWRANYGRTSPPRFTENDGDLNDDGVVDYGDYGVWMKNYGRRMP